MNELKSAPTFSRKWTIFLIQLTIIIIILITFILYIGWMPKKSYSGPFQPLSDDEETTRRHLEKHLNVLAKEIGERNVWQYQGLQSSASYIEGVFTQLGYEVKRQAYKGEDVTVTNLEAELPGSTLPDEIIVIGAHYDSVSGCPGANDNASGVAGLIEAARLLSNNKLSRTVRFVAFVNEEPPFFQTSLMGSRVYASRSKQLGERIIAMLSLETIGYYSDEEGSQRYPFPFSFFYPDVANFIGFVGNLSSRGLVHQAITTFRENTSFPSEGTAAPGWVTGVGWSDHWSFWKAGYPAIMITDTALFRYNYYHSPADTPDKIDTARMARVVNGIARIIADLATN